MKQPLFFWRLLLLSPIFGTPYISASDVLLPLAGTHSGEDLQLFTLLSTSSSQTTYSIGKNFTLSDFLGKNLKTPGGAFRNLQGNLFFSGATPFSSLIFKNLHLGAEGAGVFSQSSITFKNLRTLIFENNTSYGGVISAESSINFSKNHTIKFLNNSSSGQGGAIFLSKSQAHAITFANQRGEIVFANNRANAIQGIPDSGNGGAISLSHPNSYIIFENNQGILFQENSGKLGGAINSGLGTVHFTNNALPVSFLGNKAESGGAIHSDSCSFIEQQSSLSFINNQAEKLGGAICSKKITLQDNCGPILFQNNSTQGGGGAISTSACSFFAKKDIMFLNNSSKNLGGGAIYLNEPGSTLYLLAREGNIEFSNNTMVVTTKHSETKKRNAVFVKGSPLSITLLADKDQRILFYDPVLATTYSSRPVNINSPTGTYFHKGSVVFSGNRLSLEEKKNNTNRISIFNQPVVLYDGTLSLEGEAILAVHSFTQYGGLLALGPGSMLKTHNTENISPINIQISRLGLNLENLSSTLPAKIHATGSSVITLSGTPEIYDPCGLFYENHEIASSPYEMTVILSSEKEVVTTNPPSKNLTILPEQGSFPNFIYSGHGYQGSWSFNWSTNDTKKHKTLKASWIPSGNFVLNPQRKGDLVSITLWGTFSGLHATRNALIDNCLNNSTVIPIKHLSFFGGSISSLMEQKTFKSSKGFSIKHGGHNVGFRLPCSSNSVLCAEFTQLQGTISQEKESKQKSFSRISLGTLAISKNWEALSLRSSISYVEDSQVMNHSLTHQRISQGSWRNHGWAGSLGMSYAYPKGFHYIKITPFTDLEYTFISQNPFIETGYDPRYFASSELHNLSLPTGIALELRFFGAKISTLLQASMTYIKDLYRKNPSTTASLILNQYMWEIPEIAIGKEAIRVKLHATVRYKAITTYLGVSSSQQEGSVSGDAHAGIALSF
nr:polymorphic outer membrane protein middle domain-containing protein [Chlamydia sp. 17-3921]